MRQSAQMSGSALSPGHITNTAAAPYILTLCRLAAPVNIRPPTAPHFKPFKFFTTRTRGPDGSERLHLHMGYFETEEQARQWAERLRRAYPNVIATRAPAELLRLRDSRAPTLAPTQRQSDAVSPSHPAPVDETSLTDTQVLQILEARRTAPAGDSVNEDRSAEISLLRPDDTDTRRVLKEAVVQGAPVSFAVQLHWSVQPIDWPSVPSLSIFRAYTLYATRRHREGRTWHSLRLGFFSDAISAKQVAYYVRSSFASVAVVPIGEDERAGANEYRIDPSVLTGPTEEPDAFQRRLDEALDADRALTPEPSRNSAGPAPNQAVKHTSPTRVDTQPKRTTSTRRAAARKADSLEQTLEMLAASELWIDDDSHSDTGVRHLKIQVQKNLPKRS